MQNLKLANARGLSLVEILVVLFCVAMLAVLLIPTLAGVKRSAQSSVCLKNLRTLHLGNQLIVNDTGKFYAPNPGQGVWWWGDERSHLGKYLDEKGLGKLLFCPAAKDEPMGSGVEWMRNRLSYLYNWHLAGAAPARVSHPAEKVMFMDGQRYGIDQYGTFEECGSFRHGGKANIVFVDGHCESLPLDALSKAVNLGTYREP